MGTTIKFLQRTKKCACFLIEISDLEEFISRPLKLEAHLFEKLDSILRTCNTPLKISIDTEGYPEVLKTIELYKNTSKELAKYCLKKPVKIYSVQ